MTVPATPSPASPPSGEPLESPPGPSLSAVPAPENALPGSEPRASFWTDAAARMDGRIARLEEREATPIKSDWTTQVIIALALSVLAVVALVVAGWYYVRGES